MIEGGGLGIYTPEEVGPMSFQVPNGVVDILVEDEAEAVQVAKKYLSYFQGSVDSWEAPDQRKLRHVVPENRLRLYDMREIIDTLADVDSVLEIRKEFGIGVITCFIRVEGKPMGVIANNPHHLAGAIDSDGADKGTRFIQLCDAFDIPVLSLMDCPGMMVGPDVEQTALVRHCVRMFNAGANLTTPLFGVIDADVVDGVDEERDVDRRPAVEFDHAVRVGSQPAPALGRVAATAAVRLPVGLLASGRGHRGWPPPLA